MRNSAERPERRGRSACLGRGLTALYLLRRPGDTADVTTERPAFDALLPAEMAARAEEVGVRKARLDAVGLFALAVLAGAFISLGAIFATTVGAGAGELPSASVRLLAGLAFSLGLILVIVGGAELFTGNNLIVMAWASRKVSAGLVLRNWSIVYVGNLVGALATVVVMFLSGQYTFGNGSVGVAALAIGNAKAGLDFVPADRARHDVQRAGLPGGLADVQRPDDDRPHPRDRAADRRLRGRRLRAQRRQHVLHPGGDRHPDLVAPDRLLGRHRRRPGRLSRTSPSRGSSPTWCRSPSATSSAAR